MLTDLLYGGAYKADGLTITVTLDDPARYGLTPDRLVFTVSIASGSDTELHAEDFAFYLLDDSNNVYNAVFTLNESGKNTDGESHAFGGIIHTELDPAYLFQELRIAFYHSPRNRINTITLDHH